MPSVRVGYRRSDFSLQVGEGFPRVSDTVESTLLFRDISPLRLNSSLRVRLRSLGLGWERQSGGPDPRRLLDVQSLRRSRVSGVVRRPLGSPRLGPVFHQGAREEARTETEGRRNTALEQPGEGPDWWSNDVTGQTRHPPPSQTSSEVRGGRT